MVDTDHTALVHALRRHLKQLEQRCLDCADSVSGIRPGTGDHSLMRGKLIGLEQERRALANLVQLHTSDIDTDDRQTE